MFRATELAHIALRKSLKFGDTVVDATAGNGHDTLFLANIVGPTGTVYAFDIQEEALAETARRTGAPSQVRLIHAGHEELAAHLPADVSLAAVMFNLGYLPGASKDITTRSDTTLSGLEQALARLAINGFVTMVLYPGHPGGEDEAAAVRRYAETLAPEFRIARHARSGTRLPAPELLIIEHLR